MEVTSSSEETVRKISRNQRKRVRERKGDVRKKERVRVRSGEGASGVPTRLAKFKVELFILQSMEAVQSGFIALG